MKIAAVHMDTILGDVNANMDKAKKYIEEAVKEGVELIIFPEFFTSGFAFNHKILDVVCKYDDPQKQLTAWAKEYNIIIGGSYLKFNGHDVLNTFTLTFPSGEMFSHSKDIPTVLEGFCYAPGDEESVLKTPIGNIGVALCWEHIRYNTAKRMLGKVDLVIGGSCWWSFSENEISDLKIRERFNLISHEIALNAPIDFAKILHVPVVHASHKAEFEDFGFPKGDKLQIRKILGAAQIVDDDGNVVKRKMYNEAAGIIISEIDYNRLPKKVEPVNTNDYWIPDMPKGFLKYGWDMNPVFQEYYKKVAKPYIIKEMTCK